MFLPLRLILSSLFAVSVLCSHSSRKASKKSKAKINKCDVKRHLGEFTEKFTTSLFGKEPRAEIFGSGEPLEVDEILTNLHAFSSSRSYLRNPYEFYCSSVSKPVSLNMHKPYFDALAELAKMLVESASWYATVACKAKDEQLSDGQKKLLEMFEAKSRGCLDMGRILYLFSVLRKSADKNAVKQLHAMFLGTIAGLDFGSRDCTNAALKELSPSNNSSLLQKAFSRIDLQEIKDACKGDEDKFIDFVLKEKGCECLFNMYSKEPRLLFLERILTTMTIKSLDILKEDFVKMFVGTEDNWSCAVSIFEQRRNAGMNSDILEEAFINAILKEHGWNKVLDLYKGSSILPLLSLSRDQAGRMAIYSNSDSIEGLIKSIKYFETKSPNFSFRRKISSMFRAEFDRLIKEHFLAIDFFDSTVMFSQKLALDSSLCNYVVELFVTAIRMGLQVPKLTFDLNDAYVFNHHFKQILDEHKAAFALHLEATILAEIPARNLSNYFYNPIELPEISIERFNPVLAKVLENNYEVRVKFSLGLMNALNSIKATNENQNTPKIIFLSCDEPIVSLNVEDDLVVVYIGNFTSEEQTVEIVFNQKVKVSMDKDDELARMLFETGPNFSNILDGESMEELD